MKKVMNILAALLIFVSMPGMCREAMEIKLSSGRDVCGNKAMEGDLRLRLTFDRIGENGEDVLLCGVYDHNTKEVNDALMYVSNKWKGIINKTQRSKGKYKSINEVWLMLSTPMGMRAIIFNDYYDDTNFLMLRVAIYDYATNRELYVFTAPRQPTFPAYDGNMLSYIITLLIKASDAGVIDLDVK